MQRKERGSVPDFGMSESRLLQTLQQVETLTASNNALVDEFEAMRRLDVPNKALEAHYMLRALITLLVEKGVFAENEVSQLIQRLQMQDMGFVDKPGEAVAARGDTLLIRFRVIDGDRVVEDETGAPVAYELGSNRLGCDDALEGMRPGEARSATTVFSPSYHLKELAGREATVEVRLEAIKVKAQEGDRADPLPS